MKYNNEQMREINGKMNENKKEMKGEINKNNEILAAQLGAQITTGMAGWFIFGRTKENSKGTCLRNDNGLEEQHACVDVVLPQKETVEETKIDGLEGEMIGSMVCETTSVACGMAFMGA